MLPPDLGLRLDGIHDELAAPGSLRFAAVIDASGRRSKILDWIAAAGAPRPAEETSECGIVYYSRYFRFTAKEMQARRDGIFIDQMPMPLRPFIKQVFSDAGQKVMNTLGVPKTMGKDNAKLVNGSPLLLAALLTREEYIPGELSGFYSLLGLGMAIENIWLTTTDLGMGIQFVSTPMEFPESWNQIRGLLEVPDDLELIAMYRLGYLPDEQKRPSIDWVSNHRKRFEQYVFRNTCATPERDPEPEA